MNGIMNPIQIIPHLQLQLVEMFFFCMCFQIDKLDIIIAVIITLNALFFCATIEQLQNADL